MWLTSFLFVIKKLLMLRKKKKIVNWLLLEQNRVRSIPWRLATSNENPYSYIDLIKVLILIYQYIQSKNVFLFYLSII